MRRGFDGTALETQFAQRDRELTIGPIMLSVVGLGLLALCALCFISGYALGHRSGAIGASTAAGKEAPSAEQLLVAQSKRSASQGSSDPKVDAVTDASGAPATLDDSAVNSTAGAAGTTSEGGAVVPAALPSQTSAAQTAVLTQPGVHPALGQNSASAANWMVQIATTQNAEDADVMVNALRKRGFAVSARRDALDNLIHVQVGPLSTHADAAAMRQKLLDAGYNAIIQP